MSEVEAPVAAAAAVAAAPAVFIASNIKVKMPTIIIGSLTLVAGLAWNDAFRAIIDHYVPEKYKNSRNAWVKIVYAFVLTIIIVIVISIIVKYSNVPA